jgi:hypothetical protein
LSALEIDISSSSDPFCNYAICKPRKKKLFGVLTRLLFNYIHFPKFHFIHLCFQYDRHYGDVEEITVEEPIEHRPPLYAHVTFFSQMTIFHVLDGNKRVKFMTRGKHLWARKFVPKKQKKVEE